MMRRALALGFGIGAVLAAACAGGALAQEPKAAEPAAPAEGTVELPKMTVEATGKKKTPEKKAAAKQAPATAQAAAPISAPSGGEGRTETGTGPLVNGYAAKQTTTGIKTDTPLREITQSISVVGAEQIRDQAASTIQQTLRYVPGVLADSYGTDNRGDYPRMRGGDPDIFLDGLRFSDAWRFGESRLDPYTLERVEVLKGPASMLYGQSSVAGLINAVSKRPQEETYREVGFEVGSFERLRMQTDMTGKITEDGKWLYRFIAVGQQSDAQTDFVDDDRVLIQPSITWKPTSATSLTLIGKYQKDDSGSMTSFLPHAGTIFPGFDGRRIPIERFVSEPGFDDYRTETASVSALFEHKFSEVLTLRQNMRYLHTDNIYHSMFPDVYSNPAFPFLDPDMRTVARYIWLADAQRDNFVSDTNLETKFATGAVAHKLLVGFDHRRIYQETAYGDGFDATPFDLYDPVYDGIMVPGMVASPDELQTQSGIYAQDQLRFGNWIGVLGVRHDWAANDVDTVGKEEVEETTYRAGLMYELPFGLTPYYSYAQSFSPQYGSGCETPCDPFFGEQHEVGFKYQAAAAFVINGALYEVTEQNRLTYGTFQYPKTIGEARTRGAEIEFIGRVTENLEIVGGYAYTDAIVTKGDTAGKHIPTVAEHQASLWGKYSFAMFGIDGFSVGAGVRYIGSSWDGSDVIETPAVTLVDAMFGWENDDWRFQINGTNLEDKYYMATCLDRGDCFLGTGRVVTSNLTYKF